MKNKDFLKIVQMMIKKNVYGQVINWIFFFHHFKASIVQVFVCLFIFFSKTILKTLTQSAGHYNHHHHYQRKKIQYDEINKSVIIGRTIDLFHFNDDDAHTHTHTQVFI